MLWSHNQKHRQYSHLTKVNEQKVTWQNKIIKARLSTNQEYPHSFSFAPFSGSVFSVFFHVLLFLDLLYIYGNSQPPHQQTCSIQKSRPKAGMRWNITASTHCSFLLAKNTKLNDSIFLWTFPTSSYPPFFVIHSTKSPNNILVRQTDSSETKYLKT